MSEHPGNKKEAAMMAASSSRSLCYSSAAFGLLSTRAAMLDRS